MKKEQHMKEHQGLEVLSKKMYSDVILFAEGNE